MTVTGYEFTKTDRSRKHTVGLCHYCAKYFGLSPFNDKHEKLTEHSDTMFRHGTGDSLPCIGCGFDINSSLASNAIRGKTDRELVTVAPENRPDPPLPALAGLFNNSVIDVFADITLAPGEKPEEVHHVTDDDGNPIAKTVRHPDSADETFRVMVDAYKNGEETYSAQELENRATRIAKILAGNGMNTEYGPMNPSDKSENWYVLAAHAD